MDRLFAPAKTAEAAIERREAMRRSQ